MKPHFAHDCSHCLFLGHKNGRDWYYCSWESGNDGAIIGRAGNAVHDTSSVPLSTLKNYKGPDSTFIMDAQSLVKEKNL